MTKKIAFNRELQEKLLKGADVLADAVGATLGPKGRTVIVKEKKFRPFITKDGVSVAKQVQLSDPFENAGVEILRQAAESTVQAAGDGTTTATVLARSILKEAQGYLVAGSSPVEMKKGMDLAVNDIIDFLKEKAVPVESLEMVEQIATVSANGDIGIGKMIATAVESVGKDGSITIKQSKTENTTLEVEEGFKIASPLASKALVTDERRGVARYEDCNVLVTDFEIQTIDEILSPLNFAARDGKPFVIVCSDIKDQALAAVIMNKLNGNMKVTAIKAPSYGQERREILSDLSTLLGATFISDESGLRLTQAELKDFGKCAIFEGGRSSSLFVGGEGNDEKLETLLESLKNELQEAFEEPKLAKRLQERITRLSSGIALVRVGGNTEVEAIEKMHRVEDALEAVSSARQEGIIPGGGTALIHAARNCLPEVQNNDQAVGVEIIKKACYSPLRQMLENAGGKVDLIIDTIETAAWGQVFDVSNGDYVNYKEKGILDPFKVTRCALQNAVSAAGTLLTTTVAIVEVAQEND